MTLRLRLTALYTLLFGACGALLLGLSSWIVHRQVERTLPPAYTERALDQLDAQYVLALGGMLLVAVALGYLVAGRGLAPLRRVTGLAQRVTQERLGERIAMEGPHDELRDLADTLDGMLDRLESAFDGQRRFVANASHELRTPLTIIRAEVEVALADPDASVADLRRMGDVVLEAADRTQALLDSLMVLARSQQATLRREPIDLEFAVRHAVDHSLAEAAARGVELRVDLQSSAIEGDRPLVERLVANLVENAVRHNVPGGIVRVTTQPGSVRVENTGAVIEPEDVRRLAEPFERLGRDSDGPGAGLGLSIVRAVADAHGAELTLTPRAGGGLDARVTFPHSSPSGSTPARSRSTWAGVNGGEASAESSWYARNR